DSDVAVRWMHSGVEVYAAGDGPGENTGQVKNMSKSIAIALSTVVAGAIAAAQTGRPLNLRGDRFKPLTWEQLTVQQKTMVDDLLSGSRSSLNGPFNVLLRSPEMGNLAQKLGEYVRFHTSVPRRLNEMAILLTAKAWSCQYEWHAHKPLALDAGHSASVVDDIQAGRLPARMQPDEAIVYDLSNELPETHREAAATYARPTARPSETG